MCATVSDAHAVGRLRRPETPDPRPVLEPGAHGWRLVGGRCRACGHANPTTAPCCPRCGAPTEETRFGPAGVIWSTTTIHIAHGERTDPYTLAYVDLDDGPRVLVHLTSRPVAVGDRVRLREHSHLGDPQVEVVR
jgi:uncharacterized OB-fold protein